MQLAGGLGRGVEEVKAVCLVGAHTAKRQQSVVLRSSVQHRPAPSFREPEPQVDGTLEARESSREATGNAHVVAYRRFARAAVHARMVKCAPVKGAFQEGDRQCLAEFRLRL